MIYLTFDSNIWIYSLDESWKIENQLDYLEPWIQNGNVKVLLPKIIIDEWGKHENEQVKKREEKLRDFFEMAEEILPSAFYAEYKEPFTQGKIINNQLARAKTIILNCEIIPDYPEVKQRIIEDGISKKAPMHKKSSIADAIIVYSLIQYAKNNLGNHYFFVSNNTEDFYQKNNNNKEIHQDLKQDFDNNSIQAFTTLEHLIYKLKSAYSLKVDVNIILQKKRERIRNKIKEKVYNPEYDKLTESGESSYIQNINTIEFILNETKPTKEQVIFVLALIDSDVSFERDFYRKLSNGNWFEILKRKGVFNPENNPSPVEAKEGFQVPFWESLFYLEKISLQIKEGNEPHLVDEIIAIIDNVSKNRIVNYRTWYFFCKILSNLPNDKIPITLLTHIPKWLSGNFDTMLHSSEICQKLLPKFLSENPSNDDIVKAELILKHLLSVENKHVPTKFKNNNNESRYSTNIYLDYLTKIIVDEKLAEKIVAHCSDQIIIDLANNIKLLCLDFPHGINISIQLDREEYFIKTEVEGENLNLFISNKIKPENVIVKDQLLDFEKLSKIQLKDSFISILKKYQIKYEETKDNEFQFDKLNHNLLYGSDHKMSNKPIRELNIHYFNYVNIVEAFALIFRDLLNFTVRDNRSIELLKLFAFNNKYRLPFFRRSVLFVISENWEITKIVFWEMIKINDPFQYFSNHSFKKDIYELLKSNQNLFINEEIQNIQKIIEFGPQEDIVLEDSNYIEYWQLGWYSALNGVSPFKEKYEGLSQKLDYTYQHFENLGKVSFKPGDSSPITINHLLQKNNKEISSFIHSFKPNDRWEEPSIGGLASTLGYAIESKPEYFADEIDCYDDVYYIYAYHIASGFEKAWKNGKTFSWENVLNFSKRYVTSDKFGSEELSLKNDGWGATADWVNGAIANLLTEGMQSDSHAFDLELLPIVKDILRIVVPRLKAIEDFNETNMDYPTYSLNSTAGKTLRALLDYSLRRARNLTNNNQEPKWEEDIKFLFESIFDKGIIDGYILIGWYFQQFYFLDENWTINKIKLYYKLADTEWIAFLNGFAFGNLPFNKKIYKLFYPHYKKAIERNIKIKHFYGSILVHHIANFYLWGFEDLETKGLLLLLLEKGDHSNILELINYIWRQEEYLNSLDEEEKKKVESIIFKLWNYLAKLYENANGEDEENVLTELSNFLLYVPELNKEYTDLVLKSIRIADSRFHLYPFIENLIKLKDRGRADETAIHIGSILNFIQFNQYFSTEDQMQIIDLTVFLYENNQKEKANEFCNKMVKEGHEFFIEIHSRYKD